MRFVGLPRAFYVAAIVVGFSGLPLADAHAQARGLDSEFQLDIPSQPLADALIAYGAATGLEVFYDGDLAVGRRSEAVKGTFTARFGLQTLLRGTGYVPQATANADTITIVTGPRQKTAPPASEADQLRRYQSYFALLQVRVREGLCSIDDARPGDGEILLSFWLGSSGVVTRVETLGSDGSPARRSTVAAAMVGLRIGKPLPAGLPQPVTMVIFSPSAGEPTGCLSADRFRADKVE